MGDKFRALIESVEYQNNWSVFRYFQQVLLKCGEACHIQPFKWFVEYQEFRVTGQRSD